MVAVYCLNGMSYFGKLAAKLLNADYHEQIPLKKHYDTVLIVGMYDWPLYQTTLEHTQDVDKRVVMWCGTDVMFCPHDAGVVLPEATHLCDSENLRNELWERGIDATVVPWPAANHFDVTPLPELPTVAFYAGNDAEKYGWCTLRAALNVLEHQQDFGVINYQLGEYTPKQMQDLVANATVYVRLPEHDGGAMSAKEFLEAGRSVICTQDLKYAKRIRHDDLPALVGAIKTALKQTEPNHEAAAYWHAQNSVERWRKQLGGVL